MSEVSEGWEARQRWADERRGVGGGKGVVRLCRVSEGKTSRAGTRSCLHVLESSRSIPHHHRVCVAHQLFQPPLRRQGERQDSAARLGRGGSGVAGGRWGGGGEASLCAVSHDDFRPGGLVTQVLQGRACEGEGVCVLRYQAAQQRALRTCRGRARVWPDHRRRKAATTATEAASARLPTRSQGGR